MSESVVSLVRQQRRAKWGSAIGSVLFGSLLLVLCSQVRIPVGPVPITFQTLGVFVLGSVLGGKRGAAACLLYLIEATVGLPVLAGWRSNPLWFVVMGSGYLISFPFAAFVIGWMREKRKHPSCGWSIWSFFCGQVVIYFFGVSRLAMFIGIKNAILWGVLPFVIPGAIKVVCAQFVDQWWRKDEF